MPSIEILMEKPCKELSIDPRGYSFALKTSRPPLSDRVPSLWQSKFTTIGGVLIHIGETRFKREPSQWFYAYNIIEEEKCTRFRFKAEYMPDVLSLLTYLLARSKSHMVHFTSDWQLGPKPARVYTKPITLRGFVGQHDARGLRFNSWLSIFMRE